MSAITLTNIQFGYSRKQQVLDNINLEVPTGSIYGFLGKNGAGKSTTLRVILSLLKANKGSVKVMDRDIRKNYPAYLSKIGTLVENPSLYGHLHAEDNLKISCKYTDTDYARIDEVLDQVNLTYAKNKKVKNFSTGMKQRLGVAIALLQNPEILILDEPTNGLDPQGIIEFRNVMHRLQAEGKTIMLSSHILSEVEKIATVLGIIHQGSIVFEGSIQDLQALKSLEAEVKVSDPNKALDLLKDDYQVLVDKNILKIAIADEIDLSKIIRTLADADLDIFKANPISKGLEQMFIEATDI